MNQNINASEKHLDYHWTLKDSSESHASHIPLSETM